MTCHFHIQLGSSMAVAEWVARKETHEENPFADPERRSAPARDGVGSATASTANRVIASSDRVQRANGRIYFPIADVDATLFELSSKRWR